MTSPHTHPAERETPAGEATTLSAHERRILAFLDQRGPTHRKTVVWELASPNSKIGRARDTGSGLGGGSSGNGEALIMGKWCRSLVRRGLVAQECDARGFYRAHATTPKGRAVVREARS